MRVWLSLIRFSHTVFALPFALASLLVASDGAPGWRVALLVVAAMVGARTAAMAYNRFADRDVDALNPRTREREIPRGVVTPRGALALTVAGAAVFVAAAFLLNPLCGWLSLPVLGVLLGYSHAKRFTPLAHVWLGFALALSPLGAWVAVTGRLDATLLAPGVLAAGVLAWVAGFDILYACQDEAFDRAHGLHSLVTRLGGRAAMRLARVLHVVAIAGFAGFGTVTELGGAWLVGVGLAAGLLALEHRLVRPGDLSRIRAAFFALNAQVAVLLFLVCVVDVYLV